MQNTHGVAHTWLVSVVIVLHSSFTRYSHTLPLVFFFWFLFCEARGSTSFLSDVFTPVELPYYFFFALFMLFTVFVIFRSSFVFISVPVCMLGCIKM